MYTHAGVVESNASALPQILRKFPFFFFVFWCRLLLCLLIFERFVFSQFPRWGPNRSGLSRRQCTMNRGAATTDEWRTLIINLDRPARDNFRREKRVCVPREEIKHHPSLINGRGETSSHGTISPNVCTYYVIIMLVYYS